MTVADVLRLFFDAGITQVSPGALGIVLTDERNKHRTRDERIRPEPLSEAEALQLIARVPGVAMVDGWIVQM